MGLIHKYMIGGNLNVFDLSRKNKILTKKNSIM